MVEKAIHKVTVNTTNLNVTRRIRVKLHCD